MKYYIFFIASILINLNLYAKSENPLEACGKATFDSNMTCEKPSVKFDVSECDTQAKEPVEATKYSCEDGELIANLKLHGTSYRAVFIKYLNAGWAQKGQVWKVEKSKSKKNNLDEDAKINQTPVEFEPIKEVKKKKKKHKSSEASESVIKDKIEDKKIVIAPEKKEEEIKKSAEVKEEASWKLKFGGWAFVEYESLQNIGDGVTNIFDSNDSFSKQNDTSWLSNFQFTVSKENLTLDSIFEVGEVYFGDSTTNGNQGLRGKIIEVRNLNLQEEFEKNWYIKLGLYSPSADPRGFILSDHHAEAQLRYEDEQKSTQLWYANATGSKPGTTVVGDSYIGILHTQKYSQVNTFSVFATERSTRENFIDTDLVTPVSGRSKYYWLGVNNIMKNIPQLTNFEFNLIASHSQFKSDGADSSDSNTGWLAHLRADRDIETGWNLAVDGLATTGSNDSRIGAVQVLGKRKNFASPDPSEAYLLTIATSDGADDAAGSVRANVANNPGRLDLDEGLRLAVVTVSKSFGEKWESFIRVGQIKTASARLITDSDDYGQETDLHLKYKSTKNTSWNFDYAIFNPGNYFVQKDQATLISLKYRLDF